MSTWTIQPILAHCLSFACTDYAEQFNGVTWPPETIGHLLSVQAFGHCFSVPFAFWQQESKKVSNVHKKISFPFLFYALSLTARRGGGKAGHWGTSSPKSKKTHLTEKRKGRSGSFPASSAISMDQRTSSRGATLLCVSPNGRQKKDGQGRMGNVCFWYQLSH